MNLIERLRTHLKDYAAAGEAADRIEQLEAALKRIAEGELASVVRQQADRIGQLETALLTILANTEEDASPHVAYDGLTAYQALARDIADCARAALDRSCQPKATP